MSLEAGSPPESTPGVQSPRHASWLVFALVLAVTATTNLDASFVYDDVPNISGNPAIIGFSPGSWEAWGRVLRESPAPGRIVSNLSFAFQWWMTPGSPRAFHLVNDVLHALAAVVLFWLIVLMLRKHGPTEWTEQRRTLLALFGALLWALHPIQTQAVTYVVQRMSVLAGLFSACALLAYLRVRAGEGSNADYAWSTVFYLLALLSKENAAVLLVIVGLYELTLGGAEPAPWRRTRWIGLGLACVPPLAIAAFYANASSAHFAAGALPNRDFTLFERILSTPRMYLHYLAELVFPMWLAVDHPVTPSRGLLSPWTTLLAWVISAVGCGWAARIAFRDSVIAVCALAFVLALLPESTFLNLRLYFEHRLYLPSLFVLPLIPVAGLHLWEKYRPAASARPPAVGGLVLIALCAVATGARNRDWQGPVRLWRSNVEIYPESVTAQTNLGSALIDADQATEALGPLHKAARLDPNDAAIRYNLARGYFGVGDYLKAAAELEVCLELDPRDPDAAHLLALSMERLGEMDKAGRFYRRALKTNPADETVALNYAAFLMEQGRARVAAAVLHRRLEAGSNSGRVMRKLALALEMSGDPAAATLYHRRACERGERESCDPRVLGVRSE